MLAKYEKLLKFEVCSIAIEKLNNRIEDIYINCK